MMAGHTFSRHLIFAVLAASLALAVAQRTSGWIVESDHGAASVPAFTYPEGMPVEDAVLIVTCADDTTSGLRVLLSVENLSTTLPDTMAGMARLDQDPVRRFDWVRYDGRADRVTPRDVTDADALVDDVRRGGTLSVRLFLTPGIPDFDQPTFQYLVDGFAEIESELSCPPVVGD